MSLHLAYFGLPLGALLLGSDGHILDVCVTSPIAAPGLRRLRTLHGTRVLRASELGPELDAEVDRALAERRPDVLVSWFWTRKLPERWLRTPRLAALGVHPSLLPRHRGRDPYFWAIDSGDSQTGVSVHLLEPEYDVGAVLDRQAIDVGQRNAWQLARALDRPSLAALRRTLQRYARGELPLAVPQDPAGVTLAPEPTGDLLRVDFHWSTERVLRRIRALSPTPGLPLALADLAFFVTAASPTSHFLPALEPGEAQILDRRLLLRTSDGALVVERALMEGEDDDADVLNAEELARRVAERLTSRSSELRAFAWNAELE
jgi:methionyl-tRNA formyltransferase